MKQPATIELWKQQSGQKLSWWEPINEKLLLYKICDKDGNQMYLRQRGSEIATWRVIEDD